MGGAVCLFQADCLEVMPTLPDESVDMILADLPYGTTQNKWDSLIPLEPVWKEFWRICKGAVVLTSQGVFTAKLILSAEKQFAYKLVWHKSKATNFLNAKKQPLRKHEDICVFYKSQPTYNPQMAAGAPFKPKAGKDFTSRSSMTGSYGEYTNFREENKGTRYPTDVVYFKTAESEGRVWHGTQKPVALMEYLIRTYTDEGATVLDPTMGSGTTGVACMNTDRSFIGVEKDPGFFAIAERRIAEAQTAHANTLFAA